MSTLRSRVPSNVVLGAAVLLVGLGAFVWVASGSFYSMLNDVFHGGGRTVRAVFPDAQQLEDTGFMRSGSDVRIDGVNVGNVTGIALNPGGHSATATLSLDDSAGPLYADARASLRWRTLLGASFYVAIDRGSPNAGPLGSKPIPPNHTSDQIELQDVLSVLQGGAKSGLTALPKPLAIGLSDPSALSSALSTLASDGPTLKSALSAVRGEQPATDLQTLINSAGSALRALETPTDQLRTVVAGAAATLTATADQQANLQRTIAEAPGALQSTNATLSQLDDTLTLLDPLIAKLQRPAPDVGPTLAALHPTLVDANTLLNHAVPLLTALRPTASSLESTSKLGLPLLQQLTPSLNRIASYILPYLNQNYPQTNHTTAEMIGPAIAAYANAAGTVDTQGRMIRFDFSLGNSSFYLPCQTYIANPTAAQVLQCQTLQQMLKAVLSYNPLAPAPGTIQGPARRSLSPGATP